MARTKLIIDTDPGVDDVLAILLAFASADELEVLMLSITYGNVEVQNCLKNAISVFHYIEKEWTWRKSTGRTLGFDMLKHSKPIVAVGAENPLGDDILMADYFHGRDGLGDISKTHPHLTPEETWRDLFTTTPVSETQREILQLRSLFVPSNLPAPDEILRLLRENEPDTITIAVLGPMTNIAIAAAQDTETFLRVKEVVVMGGAVNEHGNITPVAEFNAFADTYAAARVFALTSQVPASTMPPIPPKPASQIQQGNTEPPPPFLGPYKVMGADARQLRLTLFPLDVTHRHSLSRNTFNSFISPLLESGSPLSAWVNAFMSSTFAKVESLNLVSSDAVKLDLHDPLTIWYLIDYASNPSTWTFAAPDEALEDIRVETAGQWTRGMMVIDRRNWRKRDVPQGEEGKATGDEGSWLINGRGNRVKRCVGSGSETSFGDNLLQRILGQ